MSASAVADKPQPAGDIAVDCSSLTKSYEGVPVLRGISARFMRGTVNVLAGENGAGKSTLFKIISGQVTPDSGHLALFGDDVRRFDARHAQGLGVSIIPQELAPIPDMKVWQNLMIGREKSGFGLLRRKQMIEEAVAMMEGVGLSVDPSLPMKRLNVATTQMIEILKATSRQAKIILMDEPTSSLSGREVEQLFRVIRRLQADGVCILYTSHRMEEIEAISDTVAIMRDGAIIRHAPTSTLTERAIIADMVGREITELFPDRQITESDKPVLEVSNLAVKGYKSLVSFTVKAGEILGLGGLIGAGRSEMLEAIYGMRRATGSLRLDGRDLPLGHMKESIKRGIAMVPEDRKISGILTSLSILDNITLPHLNSFVTPGGLLENGKRRAQALDVLKRTKVAYATLGQKVGHLSGGNQQKVALARWLVTGTPRLLILDEPTRGIDVGARSELYRLINDLAAQGVAVLLASSDMPELINLSHRVLVIREGAIMGELKKNELEQEAILRLAMGRSSNGKQ
ncbi:sugar ABC transporter ATP-binding protein [Acidisoma cellulosilytica]|uniref:Sugar ABC transporter ATP-binding protein n=1 Tax=Acidisoma cellulosilyticum TaxID=2802395 RepID=A0A964E3I1_9PROT|nr:sugar ABC transporter ATP-binding protein [Acidisoma cellulosilyticum]MCB8879933.1 sugar ABC transporter ATP-binding protein [Acidisoma cellulosilyticum]